MGDSTMVIMAQRGDEVFLATLSFSVLFQRRYIFFCVQAASVALSALINAMHETANCAIVRRVYASNAKVQLGCLVPHIKHDYQVIRPSL